MWTSQNEGYNQLFFKDTGQGIPRDVLPFIFDRFYSKTYHGTGIGLSFCRLVMHSYKGYIKCESVYGEFTLFELGFPISRTE